MEADDFITLVKGVFDAENDREWEREAAAFIHPRVRYEAVGTLRAIRGRDNYVRHMKVAYAKIPDWSFQILHIYGDERAVASELDGSGHFTGDHRGKRLEEAPLHLCSVCVFEFHAGRVCRVRECLDALGERGNSVTPLAEGFPPASPGHIRVQLPTWIQN